MRRQNLAGMAAFQRSSKQALAILAMQARALVDHPPTVGDHSMAKPPVPRDHRTPAPASQPAKPAVPVKPAKTGQGGGKGGGKGDSMGPGGGETP
jgi:hypothetical protein